MRTVADMRLLGTLAARVATGVERPPVVLLPILF